MKLLLIVDMINGFLKEGNMAFESGMVTVEPIIALANDFKKKGYDIAAFRDEHTIDSLEFKTYPEHCVKGTSESLLIDELMIFEKEIIDIPKRSTNGVNTEAFQKLISSNSYDEVVIVGVCTDICVLQAGLALVTQFYENNIDAKVTVVSDAVATFDSPEHNAEQYHNFSLDLLRNASVQVKESKQIIG